jgi:hypothetical protein
MRQRLRDGLFVLLLLTGLFGAAISLPPVVSAQPGSSLGSGAGVNWRADTYSAAATGKAIDTSAASRKWYGVQVKGTGAAATSWTVNLQVSLDGTNFVTIITHASTTDSDGDILWLSTPAPALHFRSVVSAVVLGSATSLVVTIIGMD